jgi:hypothetical protein
MPGKSTLTQRRAPCSRTTPPKPGKKHSNAPPRPGNEALAGRAAGGNRAGGYLATSTYTIFADFNWDDNVYCCPP